MAPRLSCGVLVTDTARVLLGHATGSSRWDIPKGLAEPNETPIAAALRELAEETGLNARAADLRDLGRYPYLPAKDLALFAWRPSEMPDPSRLVCVSRFTARDGRQLAEFDRFGLFTWEQAPARVGRNLARVMEAVRPLLSSPSIGG